MIELCDDWMYATECMSTSAYLWNPAVFANTLRYSSCVCANVIPGLCRPVNSQRLYFNISQAQEGEPWSWKTCSLLTYWSPGSHDDTFDVGFELVFATTTRGDGVRFAFPHWVVPLFLREEKNDRTPLPFPSPCPCCAKVDESSVVVFHPAPFIPWSCPCPCPALLLSTRGSPATCSSPSCCWNPPPPTSDDKEFAVAVVSVIAVVVVVVVPPGTSTTLTTGSGCQSISSAGGSFFPFPFPLSLLLLVVVEIIVSPTPTASLQLSITALVPRAREVIHERSFRFARRTVLHSMQNLSRGLSVELGFIVVGSSGFRFGF